jgi:hypothetical protein
MPSRNQELKHIWADDHWFASRGVQATQFRIKPKTAEALLKRRDLLTEVVKKRILNVLD